MSPLHSPLNCSQRVSNPAFMSHSQPAPYLARIVQDAEVSLVPQVPRPLKLGMASLLLGHLLYKGLVRGLWEPALLVQQGQHTWRVVLWETRKAGSQLGCPSLGLARESWPPKHTIGSLPRTLSPFLPMYKDGFMPSTPTNLTSNYPVSSGPPLGMEGQAPKEHACFCPLVDSTH